MVRIQACQPQNTDPRLGTNTSNGTRTTDGKPANRDDLAGGTSSRNTVGAGYKAESMKQSRELHGIVLMGMCETFLIRILDREIRSVYEVAELVFKPRLSCMCMYACIIFT
jgi:hypothetical protein